VFVGVFALGYGVGYLKAWQENGPREILTLTTEHPHTPILLRPTTDGTRLSTTDNQTLTTPKTNPATEALHSGKSPSFRGQFARLRTVCAPASGVFAVGRPLGPFHMKANSRNHLRRRPHSSPRRPGTRRLPRRKSAFR